MKDRPKISIAILTKNRKKYLSLAVEAVLKQTYSNFELLILDNHSEDGSEEFIRANFTDPRITYIYQPFGKDAGFNNGSALIMARYAKVLITHDDDIIEPTMVEEMMNFFSSHRDVAILATNVSVIDEFGNLTQSKLYPMKEDRIFPKYEYIKTYLAEKLWLPAPTFMYNKLKLNNDIWGWRIESLKNPEPVMLTDEKEFPAGDVLNVIRENMTNSVAILANPLLKNRQHSGQESKNVSDMNIMYECLAGIERLCSSDINLSDCYLAALGTRLKFQLQDTLFNHESSKEVYNEWLDMTHSKGVTNAAEIPIGLFGALRDYDKVPINLVCSDISDPMQVAYLRWLNKVSVGQSLLDPIPSKNIVILGSMLTAHLLVLDAKRAGYNVIACIDSSPQRIGKNVFDVPTLPHEALKTMTNIDITVILSSERSHEEALKEILKPNLPRPDTLVLSWKELA